LDNLSSVIRTSAASGSLRSGATGQRLSSDRESAAEG